MPKFVELARDIEQSLLETLLTERNKNARLEPGAFGGTWWYLVALGNLSFCSVHL